jgi:hypothetical protein
MGQDAFGEKGDDHVTPLRSCPVISVHDLHLVSVYIRFLKQTILLAIRHPFFRWSCDAHPFMIPHHVDSPKGCESLKFVCLVCCYEGLLFMCCSLVLAPLFFFLLIHLNRCLTLRSTKFRFVNPVSRQPILLRSSTLNPKDLTGQLTRQWPQLVHYLLFSVGRISWSF